MCERPAGLHLYFLPGTPRAPATDRRARTGTGRIRLGGRRLARLQAAAAVRRLESRPARPACRARHHYLLTTSLARLPSPCSFIGLIYCVGHSTVTFVLE